MQNLSSLFMPVESVNPCLILIVRRDNIVGDTMEVLRKSKNVDYKKPLKVEDAKIFLLSLSLYIASSYKSSTSPFVSLSVYCAVPHRWFLWARRRSTQEG